MSSNNLDAFKSPTGWDQPGSTNAGSWEKRNNLPLTTQMPNEPWVSFQARQAAYSTTK